MFKIIQLALCLITISISAQSSFVNIISSNSTQIHFELLIGELQFDIINNNYNSYTQITSNGLTKPYDIGNPDLPVYSKLIEVPFSGDISFEILNSNDSFYDLASMGFHEEVSPSQASVFKNQDPTIVDFAYNENTYSKNAFYSQDLISIERLGVMRGKSIARIQIAPFLYNPITNELIVKKDVEIIINFEESIEPTAKAYCTQDFDINFSKLLNNNTSQKQEFSSQTTRMIILSDPQFEEDLQPFIDWKKRKGFDVIVAYKGQAEVGSTKENMKAFVQSFYDNATDENLAPTYLLIVGDHEQIPSFDIGNHVSDMYYCEFTGDYFPEMIYGRFSATNSSELTIQIDKTLQYEQYTMPDPSYLDEVILVAGVDANFAPIHGNGQINYATNYYFNQEHNFTPHVYEYPETTTNVVESAIIEHVNNGVGFANYNGHCGPGGWSDPSFEVSNVVGLVNQDQYGLMVGNCPQTNIFNGVTCFGEALLRKANGGAVGYIGSSDNTLWDEDYYWSVGNISTPVSDPTYEETGLGIFDCSFHENNEQTDDWAVTQGQLLHSGNWAVSESASNNDEYYWEIYHLMGDPSLLTYYGIPLELSVSHPNTLLVGMSSLSISTDPYTYVALNQSGVLLDASYTDETGILVLSFDPLDSIDSLEIVATKHNKQVYFGAVSMFSSDTPYVSCSSISINDGELGNNQVELNESFVLDISLQNYSSVNVEELSIAITSSNPNVSISYDSLMLDSISAASIVDLNNLVNIETNGNFTNQEIVVLEFTITDSDSTEWTSINSFFVNAPELEFSSYEILSTNNIALGETVELEFVLDNVGNAMCDSVNVTISSDFTSLNLDLDNIFFSSIEANSQVFITVPVTLNLNASLSTDYNISLTALSQDGFTANYTIGLTTPICSDIDGDFICDEYEVEGCTSDWADNYNYLATDDNGSCELVACGYIEFFEYDSNYTNSDPFLCITLIVEGCTNQDAENYNTVANIEDGTCIVYGCMNADADNYNIEATIQDDSCVYYGCSNETAENYNSQATADDSTCIIYGCVLSVFPNYNAEATIDDSSCSFDAIEIYGCTDYIYIEYDSLANTNNGSCSILIVAGCMDVDAFNYDPFSNSNDGSCIDVYEGCTDVLYVEYDSFANTDDGSCVTLIVPGCTDPVACNWNPDANYEDGSCSFPIEEYLDCLGDCLQDIDVDGVCDEVDYDDGLGVDEMDVNDSKLLKMIDVLGREQKEHIKGMFLFYIYENGKVMKRIIQ